MTTKRANAESKKADTETVKDPNTLRTVLEAGKSRERHFAELGLSAVTLNTVTARIFAKGNMGEIDLTESVLVMREKVGKVTAGDTSELEATLTAQAVSLNTIFNELARRAALNMGEYLGAMETYLRLALKAQAQCARTIEVMAAMKNPPVVFAKQANIANGPQQVNNGIPSHAGKAESEQSKLITEQTYEAMDTRGTAAAIGANQELEAVGAINRPQVAKG